MTRDNETRMRFVELRAAGRSYEAIAQELDVSKPTLIQWAQELQHDIGNAQAIHLEDLQQRYHVMKQKRIELLGTRLQTMIDELAKRDLSEVPTDKLFELALKYASALRQDETATRFSTRGDNTDAILEDLNTTVRWAG